MELIKLSEHCYYSPHSDYGDRPALGYIKHKNTAALIDAGNSEEHTLEFLSLIEKAGMPMPNVVYLTHSHWDHTFGLSALSKSTKIVSTTRTGNKMEKDNKELVELAIRIRDESIRTGIPFKELLNETTLLNSVRFMLEKMYEEYDLSFDKIKFKFPTFRISNNSYTFENYTFVPIKAYAMSSPHCKDSAIYFVDKDGILFLGDSIYKDFDKEFYTDVEKRSYIMTFYRNIERIQFKIAIPSHSSPMTKEQVLKYLKKTYNL